MARQAKNKAYSNSLPANSNLGKANNEVPAYIMGPRIMLLLSVFALILIGFVMVYSASSIVALDEGLSTESYLIKQLGFAVIGIIGCVVLWKLIPYSVWMGPFAWVIWVIAIILLVATALFGTGSEEWGAKRWFFIGTVGIQPSEFVKIAFLIMAARILMEFRDGALSFRGMLVQAAVVIIIPLLFMYRSQSDLGTTLICFAGILMVMWLGEVPLKVIGLIVAAGVIFAVLALSVGYRQDRLIFLNPWDDGMGGLDAGYQLIHSFYAFAEGGLFGVGLGNSREKFLYLPMSETDFIFAIIGEELGLIGALAVIILFLVFLYAGMRIARTAPDGFGMLLAGGCTTMIVFQAFLNIGCVIGVLPTTGKPLPFISSGGSSLIASLFMLGIILSVSQAANNPSIYEQRRADLRVIRATNPPRNTSSRQSAGSRNKGAGGQAKRSSANTFSGRRNSRAAGSGKRR